MADTHVVVEIPVDEEHQQKLKNALTTISAMENHPLAEISRSSGHLLLLKLWQREEDLFSRRISMKESRMESLRSEIFQLCCFFFTFHALFLTIMLATSIDVESGGGPMCGRWWVPAMISGCTSMVMLMLVQVKLGRFWEVKKGLMNERGDNRALNRCIQELRMKGASFDLSKEPQIGKKMKSSRSVEIRWKLVTWCSEYCLTICLVCFAGRSKCFFRKKGVKSEKKHESPGRPKVGPETRPPKWFRDPPE